MSQGSYREKIKKLNRQRLDFESEVNQYDSSSAEYESEIDFLSKAKHCKGCQCKKSRENSGDVEGPRSTSPLFPPQPAAAASSTPPTTSTALSPPPTRSTPSSPKPTTSTELSPPPTTSTQSPSASGATNSNALKLKTGKDSLGNEIPRLVDEKIKN